MFFWVGAESDVFVTVAPSTSDLPKPRRIKVLPQLKGKKEWRAIGTGGPISFSVEVALLGSAVADIPCS